MNTHTDNAFSDRAEALGSLPVDNPIVGFHRVTKSFGPLRVLSRINIEFRRGEVTVILGPSGTGKSVLLKHIVGLLRPDAGEVFFDGKRMDVLEEKDLVEMRTRIGFLFQMGALFDSMSVGENIAFPLLQHTDADADERSERVTRVLRLVGLTGLEPKMPSQLSGGQRKRVALARAVVLDPALVLYDEPTTGLDPIRADVINELILALSKELGISSIVVTHDMASANKIADRMLLLYDGKVESANSQAGRRVCGFQRKPASTLAGLPLLHLPDLERPDYPAAHPV